MKKKIISIITAVTMLSGMTACGSKTEDFDKASAYENMRSHYSEGFETEDYYLQISKTKAEGKDIMFIVLDEVLDPHNLGSILRTANAAGVHGVIISKHRSAYITPTVMKII